MSETDDETIARAQTQYAADAHKIYSLPDGAERDALIAKVMSYASALNKHYSAVVIDLEAVYAAQLYPPDEDDTATYPSAADESEASTPPAEDARPSSPGETPAKTE